MHDNGSACASANVQPAAHQLHQCATRSAARPWQRQRTRMSHSVWVQDGSVTAWRSGSICEGWTGIGGVPVYEGGDPTLRYPPCTDSSTSARGTKAPAATVLDIAGVRGAALQRVHQQDCGHNTSLGHRPSDSSDGQQVMQIPFCSQKFTAQRNNDAVAHRQHTYHDFIPVKGMGLRVVCAE